MRRLLLPLFALALAGCSTVPPERTVHDLFFVRLADLCGETLSGTLVSSDPQDRDMAGQPLVARVAACTAEEVQINFAVGDDRSRNWSIVRTRDGLRLKHIHLHADGHEDALSRYGGDTIALGSIARQEFPADAFSKDLFARQKIPQSAANVWAVEVGRGSAFAYELRRPGRFFRVEFRRTRD